MSLRDYLRPSSLPALAECPGRAAMEALAVERCPALLRIVSPQAEQGTLGHAVVAQALSLIYQGPDGWSDPAEVLTKLAGTLAALDSWTADAARRCVTYAVALVDQEAGDGHNVTVETEMHLPGKAISIGRGGSADVVILSKSRDTGHVLRVVIQDHKLGFLDQGEAAHHLQLWAYAVMAWDKYRPTLGVEIHLAQGRRRDFSAASFDQHAVDLAARQIREIVRQAKAPSPALVPTITACRYCKALPLCRAAREAIKMQASEASMFGIDTNDRVALANDEALARRFADEARALMKAWARENQAVQG